MYVRKWISAAAVLSAASIVNASMVHFEGLGLHRSPNVVYYGSGQQFAAGQIDIRIDGGPVIHSFCVDLDHRIRSDWTATLTPPADVFGPAAGPLAYLFRTYAGSVSNRDEAAGLQLALWEVVTDYGSGIDLASGHFSVPAGEPGRAEAAAYLSTLPSTFDPAPPPYVLVSGDEPRSQNLLVPEPGTCALLVMSALLTAHRRRA